MNLSGVLKENVHFLSWHVNYDQDLKSSSYFFLKFLYETS